MWQNWRGEEVLRLVNEAGIRAVFKTCEVILEAARQEVPLDEGTLSDSGRTIMATENIPYGIVCFGGGPGTGFPLVPYAIRWHENSANFQHGRKRFYLRDPVNRLGERTILRALEQELRSVL